MVKFNPDNKNLEDLTFGDTLSPIYDITTQEEANEYFKDYVRFHLTGGKLLKDASAIEIARSNIMYYIGYLNDKTEIVRLKGLFVNAFIYIQENGLSRE